MDGEVVVKVEGEAPPAEAVADTATTVIEAATEIAGLIVEAKAEGEASAATVEQIKYSLDDVWSAISALNERVGIAIDLIMGVADQIAQLATLEVAELIETETEATVEAVVETAEQIAPVVETPVVAVEPEIRKSTKRQWI